MNRACRIDTYDDMAGTSLFSSFSTKVCLCC